MEQGVAQGCSLYLYDLLKEVEQADIGIQLQSVKKVGGMLFADNLVGIYKRICGEPADTN